MSSSKIITENTFLTVHFKLLHPFHTIRCLRSALLVHVTSQGQKMATFFSYFTTST
jgi:hypothetical protein